MSVVRKDNQGLYIQINGRKRRPGPVRGHAHAWDMSSGGLREGDRVKARHIRGSPLARLTLDDGRQLVWSDHTAFPGEHITPDPAQDDTPSGP